MRSQHCSSADKRVKRAQKNAPQLVARAKSVGGLAATGPVNTVAVSCKAPFRRRGFAFLSNRRAVPAQSPLTAEIGYDLPHERSSLGRIQLWHFPAWRCETLN
jgi:hypothetical protein